MGLFRSASAGRSGLHRRATSRRVNSSSSLPHWKPLANVWIQCGAGLRASPERPIAMANAKCGVPLRPRREDKAVFDSIDHLSAKLAATGYFIDSVMMQVVFPAAKLQKPLLLEGPAGSG